MLSARVDSARILLSKRHGARLGGDKALGNAKMRGKILVLAGIAVAAALGFAPASAQAHGDRVSVKDAYSAGTIVIRTGERRLYYFVGTGEAIRYPVGVGRAGMQWAGTAFIDGKYIRPAWSPPDSIRGDYRRLPRVVPGGSAG